MIGIINPLRRLMHEISFFISNCKFYGSPKNYRFCYRQKCNEALVKEVDIGERAVRKQGFSVITTGRTFAFEVLVLPYSCLTCTFCIMFKL